MIVKKKTASEAKRNTQGSDSRTHLEYRGKISRKSATRTPLFIDITRIRDVRELYLVEKILMVKELKYL